MEPLKSFEGSYDIPIEDLKRTVKLSPYEVMRWLDGIVRLAYQVRAAEAAKKPYDTGQASET